MAHPARLGDSAWQTLLGVCAIAAGCAAVLKVLAATVLFASPPPPTPDRDESEGNNPPRKKDAEEKGFLEDDVIEPELEGGGKAKGRTGRRFFLFFGGSLLRLYACDDRAALLMPMVTFLGIQSGFLVLNFLKVRKATAAVNKIGRKGEGKIECPVPKTFLCVVEALPG